MFKNINHILLALFISLLLACSQTGTIELALNDTIFLTRWEPEHRGKIKEFTSKSKDHKELQQWLNNNKEGWKRVKTELYPTHLIHSGKYYIGIIESNLTIFHMRYVDSTSIYQKPLKPNELNFLKYGTFKYKDENKT